MDNYIEMMEEYTPTLQEKERLEVIEVPDYVQVTSIRNENQFEDAPYMAPKTIEVRRYTLKK